MAVRVRGSTERLDVPLLSLRWCLGTDLERSGAWHCTCHSPVQRSPRTLSPHAFLSLLQTEVPPPRPSWACLCPMTAHQLSCTSSRWSALCGIFSLCPWGEASEADVGRE